MSASAAWCWIERLLGFAIALQAIELLQLRDALRDDGIFRWPCLRREFEHAPKILRACLDLLLSYRSFLALLGVELAAALALPWVRQPALAFVLLASALLVCVRFRGTFNGGSDSMTVLVLAAVSLARVAPTATLERACLGYVAAQLVLSYFVAGVSKLQQPSWRNGRALSSLLQGTAYPVPARWAARLSTPALSRAGSWTLLAWECAFPIALLDPTWCRALLGLGLTFHLANALLLGLNRFVWAWLSAYPALLYWSQ